MKKLIKIDGNFVVLRNIEDDGVTLITGEPEFPFPAKDCFMDYDAKEDTYQLRETISKNPIGTAFDFNLAVDSTGAAFANEPAFVTWCRSNLGKSSDGVTSQQLTDALADYGPKDVGAFSGVFALNRKGSDYYDDYTQTGNLTLSIGGSAIVGGIASVKITANGGTITGQASWINLGSDTISTTNGAKNHIIVRKTETEIQYTVKVL